MLEKYQSDVNWLMEEGSFFPSSSSSNNINIPALNHLYGSSFLPENHVLGNSATSENHLDLPNHPCRPQTPIYKYTPTAGNNQADLFSSQTGLQNQYPSNGLHQNPGFSWTTTHNQTDLEAAMYRMSLSTPPSHDHQYHYHPQQSNTNLFAAADDCNNLSGTNFDYSETLNRLRIQAALMGLQMPPPPPIIISNNDYGLPLSFPSSAYYQGHHDHQPLFVPRAYTCLHGRSSGTTGGGVVDNGTNPTRLLDLQYRNSLIGSNIHYGVGTNPWSDDQFRRREITNSLGSDAWKRLHNNHNHRYLPRPPRCSSTSLSAAQQQQRQTNTYTSLEQVWGKVCEAAKEEANSCFLQAYLVKDQQKEINMIFSEVKDDLHDLIMHQFSNLLIQRLIDVANDKQLDEILVSVFANEGRLMDACVNNYGTRVVQKLLERMKQDQQKHNTKAHHFITSALSRITFALTKSANGNHVIEKCFENFQPQVYKPLLDVIAANFLEIAVDQSGCCILQKCVYHAVANSSEIGETRDRLLAEYAANAQLLSEDRYGNYVVQSLIETIGPGIILDILTWLRGKYVSLSMNKYGSNVVEKCLKESNSELCNSMIISELINSPRFLDFLQDPYGNYVAQSALEVSTGRAHSNLVRLVLMHEKSLHSHPHGKRVLQQARASRKHRV